MISATNKQIEDIYPLSPMQQGMLFHTLYAPNSGVYVVQVSFEIAGCLNISAFEQAWQIASERYPVLRTAFVWEKVEQPLQVVGRKVKVPISLLDWREQALTTQQQQLETLLQTQRQAGFNLAKAPLMQLTLIHKQPELYQFVWSFHHLLLDGWSVPLLLGEILNCYIALNQGQVLHLTKARPYRDYIVWLQQQNLAESEQFWRHHLAGFTAPTSLRVDEQQASFNSHNPEQQKKLSPELTSQLQTFAKQHQLTLNTLIQGAFALMLRRYSGENDVVFGVTCAGRPATLTNAESMVGLFINTLPMRVQINPQQTVIPWLKQLQQQQAELRQYEHTPLVEIQRWSDVGQELPLFESLIVFENYPVESTLKSTIAEFNIQNIRTTEQNNYPLSLYVVVESTLTLRILSDRDRFAAATITRMLAHLQTLLEAIGTNPNCYLSQLPILTSVEQELIAQENNTKTEISSQCIHQLIATQAQKTPDAIAASFEFEQITYQQLNARANKLAHYLQTIGVTTETKVAICLERSITMLVGLLGILKAGGTYVPLDPSYPTDRLRYMLEDAGVNILLIQDNVAPSLVASQVINLDHDWDFACYSDSNPPSQTTPEHLAYIIYTSGSTGKPKGVQILHSALVNVLQSMQQHLQLTSADIWVSVTTIAFDIAALELYLPLTIGARVVIASTNAVDGNSLQQYLTTQQATVMQATPATWNLLVDSGWRGSQNLKAISGGEVLSSALAKQLVARATQVWNVYGPTETTIWSSIYRLRADDSIHQGAIPIGKPLANTQFHVLDEFLQLVPIGVPGELYIGGAGIARGYLNQPDLTATKFIPHPLTTASSERLYRTGDLVRCRSDATLEYLERIDYQVKLRGFRIELGEIATVLTQHPQVQQAVVMLRHDDNLEKRLVAYIVLIPGVTANSLTSELRQFLVTKLPAYMVPSAYVTLDKLPLTLNGKIDRNALPNPELTRPELETQYIVPRTEVEQAIAQIWQQVLKVDKVGIHDNFFDLGGHSLLMVKVHSQLREKFAANISLVEMFRHPTISALTEYFSQTNDENSPQAEDLRNEALAAGKQRLRQRLQQKKGISM